MAYFNVGGNPGNGEGIVVDEYFAAHYAEDTKYPSSGHTSYTVPRDGTIYLYARTGNAGADKSTKYYYINEVSTKFTARTQMIQVKAGDVFGVKLKGTASSSSAVSYVAYCAFLV